MNMLKLLNFTNMMLNYWNMHGRDLKEWLTLLEYSNPNREVGLPHFFSTEILSRTTIA